MSKSNSGTKTIINTSSATGAISSSFANLQTTQAFSTSFGVTLTQAIYEGLLFSGFTFSDIYFGNLSASSVVSYSIYATNGSFPIGSALATTNSGSASTALSFSTPYTISTNGTYALVVNLLTNISVSVGYDDQNSSSQEAIYFNGTSWTQYVGTVSGGLTSFQASSNVTFNAKAVLNQLSSNSGGISQSTQTHNIKWDTGVSSGSGVLAYNTIGDTSTITRISTIPTLNLTTASSSNLTTSNLSLPYGSISIANASSAVLTFPNQSFVRIQGPTTVFTILGMTLPTSQLNGKIVWLYNSTVANMTLVHESASAPAGQRFHSLTGANVVTTGEGAVQLIYDSAANVWVILSVTT